MLPNCPDAAVSYRSLLVNVINGVFSFYQEFRAEKATDALRQMLPSYVQVIRDGEQQRILAEDLVPGDVIVLQRVIGFQQMAALSTTMT